VPAVHLACWNRSGSSSPRRSARSRPRSTLGIRWGVTGAGSAPGWSSSNHRRVGPRSVMKRIATTGCSDRTIRRRLKTWAKAGVAQRVHAIALAAYDLIIGLELEDLAVDGCITKAPCGGDKAGPSPVDRRKAG